MNQYSINQINPQNSEIATPSRLINFQGQAIILYRYQDIEYLPAKRIVDIMGIDWRGAKRTLKYPMNKTLYGAENLNVQEIESTGKKDTVKSVLMIRVDRAYIYMARTSMERMKANGNVLSAERLLEFQQEWADKVYNLPEYTMYQSLMNVGKNKGLV